LVARTSTVEQTAGFEAQERDPKAAGVERVFAEQVSSVAERGQLEAALDYAREGDVLVVSSWIALRAPSVTYAASLTV
jgi:DNA invertase Pin-like site-specific DNA recombinase